MPTPREAFQNSVQRQGESGARLQAADFGSAGEMIGRATQGFGQQVGETAKVVAEIQRRDAETAAREADNQRLAKRMQRLYEGDGAYFNQEGRNAVLDKEQLAIDLKKIDDEAAQLIAKKPLARELYDDMTMRRNMDDMPKIFKYANEQRNRYEDQVDADAMDLAIDNAATSLEPTIIAQNIVTVGDIAERTAKRKGMNDENMLRQARQSAVGKAIGSIAQRMERQSPDEALAFVTLHAKDMDPDDAGKLMDQLAPNAAKERAGSDIGNFLVTAGQTAPVGSEPAPAATGAGPTPIPPFDAVAAAVVGYETKDGAHTDSNGKLITSYAGAQGAGQIMPDVGVDPGYGVRPLRNHSREEHVRFSKDLLQAYTKHFKGNIVLGLTAYNWGPGNLENHLKKINYTSTMSDAALIATLPRVSGPNEAARTQVQRYAADVLNKTGVGVSGAAGPSAGRPVAVGQEIDLDATINNIRNSDRTFVQKEALIAEATRMHSYGRQAKAENEEALKEAVWQKINEIGEDNFVDFATLPLALRTKLAQNPTLEAAFRKQATTNKTAIERGAAKEKEERTRLDLLELYYAAPDRFNQIDFRTEYPELKTTSKQAMIIRQEAIRKRQGDPTNPKTVDHDRVRTHIRRFTTKDKVPDNIGAAFDTANIKVQAWIDANPGKTVPDDVIAGIAREVMMPVTIVSKGSLWGTNEKTVPAYAAPMERKRVGENYVRSKVPPREAIKAQLQQIWGRTPTDEEVDAEVAKRTTARGLRL